MDIAKSLIQQKHSVNAQRNIYLKHQKRGQSGNYFNNLEMLSSKDETEAGGTSLKRP